MERHHICDEVGGPRQHSLVLFPGGRHDTGLFGISDDASFSRAVRLFFDDACKFIQHWTLSDGGGEVVEGAEFHPRLT